MICRSWRFKTGEFFDDIAKQSAEKIYFMYRGFVAIKRFCRYRYVGSKFLRDGIYKGKTIFLGQKA